MMHDDIPCPIPLSLSRRGARALFLIEGASPGVRLDRFQFSRRLCISTWQDAFAAKTEICKPDPTHSILRGSHHASSTLPNSRRAIGLRPWACCPKRPPKTVAEHVETCTSCESTVQELERQGAIDWVQELRQPALVVAGLDSPEYQRAIAAVESLGPGSSDARYVPDGPAKRPAPVQQLGEYELLEKFGRRRHGAGVQGSAYALKRTVAVKRPAQNRTAEPRRRWRASEREMEAVGRLDHPHNRPRLRRARHRGHDSSGDGVPSRAWIWQARSSGWCLRGHRRFAN